MISNATPAHVPPLGSHQRAEVGRELQATLLDLIDLSLVGKQLHWSVVGPHFRPLHLQLDELINAWRDLADTVADHAVVRALTERLADASERVRARMDRLGALDAASQDVLIEVVRELERQLWMVRAQIPLAGDE